MIGLVILSMFSLYTSIQAAEKIEYKLGAAKGTEITLQVKIINEEKLEEVLGADWEDGISLKDAVEINAKQKIVVKEVDASMDFDVPLFGSQKGIGYKIDKWEWTTESFEAEADEEDYSIAWFENPDELNDMYKYLGGFSGIIPFVPAPVDEFLSNIEYKRNWGCSDNSVIYLGNVEEKFTAIYTYDKGTGFLSSYIIKDAEDTIIYEVGSSTLVGGYFFFVFLGISGLTIVGIITIFQKKT